MGDDGRFQSDDRIPRMEGLRDFGVDVYESIALEGGGQGGKAAFRGATEHKADEGGLSQWVEDDFRSPESPGVIDPRSTLIGVRG